VQPDFHSRKFKFALQIRDDPTELGTPRQQLRKQGLPAQLTCGLTQCHVVSALGGNRCRLHAPRASACHYNPLATLGLWKRQKFALTTGNRVLNAGDRHAHVIMPDASLIAANASAYNRPYLRYYCRSSQR
jgi:hypothetical protein